MKNAVVAVMVFAILSFAAIGSASPLTDLSQGKGSLDITWRPSNTLKVGDEVDNVVDDGKKGNYQDV